MTDAAAFAGTYADFKTVKTRSAFQVIVEMPIEHAERFIAAFGMPIPGAEKPVALALLRSSTDKPAAPAQQREPSEKGKRRFDELPRSQQAALMCQDKSFQKWRGMEDESGTAAFIRAACEVSSRAELDTNDEAAMKWVKLYLTYKRDTGRMAEQR